MMPPEAFDKCAKVMGLPYPGGPHIDRLAQSGDPRRFRFSKPHIPGLDYSFSGLKTSFLYTLRDETRKDQEFVKRNMNDLCASLQHTIIEILLDKLKPAIRHTGVRQACGHRRRSVTQIQEYAMLSVNYARRSA